MNYTEKDITAGCSFRRDNGEKSRLICTNVDGSQIHFYDIKSLDKYQYSITTVLNHINTKKDVDFQNNSEHYEIF
jgi:hypothetical protein